MPPGELPSALLAGACLGSLWGTEQLMLTLTGVRVATLMFTFMLTLTGVTVAIHRSLLCHLPNVTQGNLLPCASVSLSEKYGLKCGASLKGSDIKCSAS